ncbi:MAG: hypothetical protein ABSB60_04545 [Terracidiphilus sp.]|jgi:hypothetical protein
MEIALNLVWMALALAIVRLWICHAPRTGTNQRVQLAAVVLLIVILFPIISVTDDLQVAQNLADDDVFTYLRRNDTVVPQHSISSAASMLPVSAYIELPLIRLQLIAPDHLTARAADGLAHSLVQNRPPPTA